MDAAQIVAELALTARKAGRTLSTATGAERKAALYAIADAIDLEADMGDGEEGSIRRV